MIKRHVGFVCTTCGDRELKYKIETRDLKKDNNTTLITETELFLISNVKHKLYSRIVYR